MEKNYKKSINSDEEDNNHNPYILFLILILLILSEDILSMIKSLTIDSHTKKTKKNTGIKILPAEEKTVNRGLKKLVKDE
ncbi:MAG: hypothetical protein ACOCZT_01020 [Halanaerobiales bacterium]